MGSFLFFFGSLRSGYKRDNLWGAGAEVEAAKGSARSIKKNFSLQLGGGMGGGVVAQLNYFICRHVGGSGGGGGSDDNNNKLRRFIPFANRKSQIKIKQ